MKWRTASISLLLVTVGVAAGALLLKPFSGNHEVLFTSALNGEDQQLGYYDLLSNQREVYNPHFLVLDDKITMTLTSPDDSQFMIKVNLQQLKSDAETTTFDYQPVYYADKGDARIIKSILGPGGHNLVQFYALRFGNERMIIFPSGQILSVDAR